MQTMVMFQRVNKNTFSDFGVPELVDLKQEYLLGSSRINFLPCNALGSLEREELGQAGRQGFACITFSFYNHYYQAGPGEAY